MTDNPMPYPWQQTQWQSFLRQRQGGRLAHALLLTGNRGLGKTDFAFHMAAAMLCEQPDGQGQACGRCNACRLMAAGTHPDLHHLKPVKKKDSQSKKPPLRIRIDDIRELCDSLNQTSQYSGYRIAILEKADQMTLDAANSLLKTLEEPGQQVLIILVSARSSHLPVTIRSRCQQLRFAVPEAGAALAWLQAQTGQSPDSLQVALARAYGSPLAALRGLEDSDDLELLAQAMTAAVSGRDALQYAEKLAQKDKLTLLEAMQGWIGDLARLYSCGDNAAIVNQRYRKQLLAKARKTSRTGLFRFQEQLHASLRQSAIAVNETLLWENLLLSWDEL